MGPSSGSSATSAIAATERSERTAWTGSRSRPGAHVPRALSSRLILSAACGSRTGCGGESGVTVPSSGGSPSKRMASSWAWLTHGCPETVSDETGCQCPDLRDKSPTTIQGMSESAIQGVAPERLRGERSHRKRKIPDTPAAAPVAARARRFMARTTPPPSPEIPAWSASTAYLPGRNAASCWAHTGSAMRGIPTPPIMMKGRKRHWPRAWTAGTSVARAAIRSPSPRKAHATAP